MKFEESVSAISHAFRLKFGEKTSSELENLSSASVLQLPIMTDGNCTNLPPTELASDSGIGIWLAPPGTCSPRCF